MADPLLELLRTRGFRRGNFTLASGRVSDFFIDCKPAVLSGQGHRLAGAALREAVREFEPVAAVAGVELGGCPLASATALTSSLGGQGPELDAIYVRKQAKGHGTARLLEGAGHVSEGARIVVLEDTVTTGGSTLRAVHELVTAGFVVAAAVAIVDRREGAAKAFEEASIPFRSLYHRGDFMGDA